MGHSLNNVLLQQPLEVRLFLLGVLNSFLLEWRARQISRNNNMVHFVLKQLPIPRLSAGDSSFDAIVQMSGSLLAASPQLRHFEQTLGLQAVHPTPEREAVKATIDAVVALMYGLTEHELQHILNRFDLVSASTKERIVSAYNELQEG